MQVWFAGHHGGFGAPGSRPALASPASAGSHWKPVQRPPVSGIGVQRRALSFRHRLGAVGGTGHLQRAAI